MNEITTTTPKITKMEMVFRALKTPVYLARYYLKSPKKRNDDIGHFIHKNPSLLIIVADPHSDKLIMSYKDRIVINKIKTTDGKRHNIVKNVLRSSQFKYNIDYFLAALAESMELPIKSAQQFYHWVDGALYNISKIVSREKYGKTKKG